MFEADPVTGKIDFSHNPFSMPQGGMKALEEQDPLTIKAWQYDLVCNGVELSSGAIRNHLPDVMYKAFEIAGYPNSVVDEKFPAMINAFRFGAPPHGGSPRYRPHGDADCRRAEYPRGYFIPDEWQSRGFDDGGPI